MVLKGLALIAVLVALPQAQMTAAGQTGGYSGAKSPATPASTPMTPQPSIASTPSTSYPSTIMPAAGQGVRTDCEGGTCDYQTPRISVSNPAPVVSAWPVQDRIAWATNVLLVIVGYAGILLALSTLRKIERQTRYGEAAAAAAADCAQAALLHAQAILNAERPWVLITVMPSRTTENGFVVTATNRGRSPARILSTVEETRLAADEAQLPTVPEYRAHEPEPDAPPLSMILLPGEFTGIKSFSRDDVRGICETEEGMQRIENWEERIFLYGKVVYSDLMEPPGEPTHETAWCCRYIHGKQKSGLVMAGPPDYSVHT